MKPDLPFSRQLHFLGQLHSGRDDSHDPAAGLTQNRRLFTFTLMQTNRLPKEVLQQPDHLFAIAVKEPKVPSTAKSLGQNV